MASTVRTDKVGPVSGSADFVLPTADGTVGQFLKTDGSLALGFATVASTGFNSVQFITSGNWTRPTGVTKVVVTLIGAGGGGGGGQVGGPSYFGGGGGGGGAMRCHLDVSSISSSTLSIGAAGSLGANGVNGGAGGDTTWTDGTNTLTATGAVGGYAPAGSYHGVGGAGGVPVVTAGTPESQLLLTGGRGLNSQANGSGPGNAMFGYGLGLPDLAQSANRVVTGYGHGGWGGSPSGAGSVAAGGLIIVWEYK